MPITKATASSIAPAAKGDLVAGSATNDAAVLAVGANDTVLTADSSTATGLKWATPTAGGMTLISETVASTLSSLSLSTIPQTHKQLLLVYSGIIHSTTSNAFSIRFNNSSSTVYGYQINFNNNSTFDYDFGGGNNVTRGDSSAFGREMGTSAGGYNTGAKGYLLIDNYASTSKYKFYRLEHSYRNNAGATIVVQTNGVFGDTTAITSLDVFNQTGGGTFSNATDTSIRLYGIS
jgi:hypothetical protein